MVSSKWHLLIPQGCSSYGYQSSWAVLGGRMGLGQGRTDRVVGEPCIVEQGNGGLHLFPVLTY